MVVDPPDPPEKVVNRSIVRYSEYVMGQFEYPRDNGLRIVETYVKGKGAQIDGTFVKEGVASFSETELNVSFSTFADYLGAELGLTNDLTKQLLRQYVDGEGADQEGTFKEETFMTDSGWIMPRGSLGQEKVVEMEGTILPQDDFEPPRTFPNFERLLQLAEVCQRVSLQHENSGFQSSSDSEKHVPFLYKYYTPSERKRIACQALPGPKRQVIDLYEENIVEHPANFMAFPNPQAQPFQECHYQTSSDLEQQAGGVSHDAFSPYQRDIYRTESGFEQKAAIVHGQAPHGQLDYHTPSDSAHQSQAAGMDWTNDQSAMKECSEDLPHLSSEESPVLGGSSIFSESSEEIVKEFSLPIDLGSGIQMHPVNPSLIKFAEVFGKVKEVGFEKAQEILKGYIGNEGRNVPGTFMPPDQMAPQAASAMFTPTDQMAPQAASTSDDTVDPKNLIEQMQNLDMKAEAPDVEMDNLDVPIVGAAEGQGETAANKDGEASEGSTTGEPIAPHSSGWQIVNSPSSARRSTTQQIAFRQAPAQAGSSTKFPAQEASTQQASTSKTTGKKATAKRGSAAQPRSYKAVAGNIHFDILLTKRVITAGDHILIPHHTETGPIARMEYVSLKNRVSSWKVYCEELGIDGNSLEGTGPAQWSTGLEGMGFKATQNRSGFGIARVFHNGEDIGSINELKTKHA